MRNGLLWSLAACLASASLAFAQVPYGYAPVPQPYPPPYGYYGYQYVPGYPAGYALPPAYGYVPAYPVPYGMQPRYIPGYPAPYGQQPGCAAAPASYNRQPAAMEPLPLAAEPAVENRPSTPAFVPAETVTAPLQVPPATEVRPNTPAFAPAVTTTTPVQAEPAPDIRPNIPANPAEDFVTTPLPGQTADKTQPDAPTKPQPEKVPAPVPAEATEDDKANAPANAPAPLPSGPARTTVVPPPQPSPTGDQDPAPSSSDAPAPVANPDTSKPATNPSAPAVLDPSTVPPANPGSADHGFAGPGHADYMGEHAIEALVDGPIAGGGAMPVAGGGGPQTWISGEYLMWKLRSAPIPLPLATLGVETAVPPPASGALNQVGTGVISPSQANFDWAPGGRVNIGAWLTSDRSFGVEWSGFLLAQQQKTFLAGVGPGSVSQVLSVPYFDLAIPGENALQLNEPLGSPGATQAAISIQNRIQLWGMEANGIARLVDTDWLSIGALGGIRYLDLAESLTFNATSINGPTAVAVPPNAYISYTDRFATRNQFYGGQLGLEGEARFGVFFVNVMGKCALGPMHETVNITGSTVTNFNGPASLAAAALVYNPTPVITPTGIFAQPTNIGQQGQDHFAVVPEVRVDLGMELFDRLRLFCGYDFLYASSVMRPGDQIDRQINSANLAPPGGFFFPAGGPTTLVAPFRPLVPLSTTSFWAQGINVGLEFRF